MNDRKGSRALTLALSAVVLTLFAWLIFTAAPSSDTKVEARALAQAPYTHSVSNLTKTTNVTTCSLNSNRKCAIAFTTGSASQGYKLTTIKAKFRAKNGNPSGFAATLRGVSGGNPGSVLANLSGSAPDTAGDHTYTCPSGNSGCNLAEKRTYFIHFEATGSGGSYYYEGPTDSDEVRSPDNNEWSIANLRKVWVYGTWAEATESTAYLEVSATTDTPPTPTPTPTDTPTPTATPPPPPPPTPTPTPTNTPVPDPGAIDATWTLTGSGWTSVRADWTYRQPTNKAFNYWDIWYKACDEAGWAGRRDWQSYNVSVRTHTITGLTANKCYKFRLSAWNKDGTRLATAFAGEQITAGPTPTPTPTNTPVPTNTPTPTNTPVPTDTPTPTDTPRPRTRRRRRPDKGESSCRRRPRTRPRIRQRLLTRQPQRPRRRLPTRPRLPTRQRLRQHPL